MKYLNDNIYYLQKKDFDSSGKLINKDIPNDKFVVIMIQANFCGFCTMAKPEYKKFADTNKNIFCCTIQSDGDVEGEKDLSKMLNIIDSDFEGFPHYVVYKNGSKVATYKGDRTSKNLTEFVRKLK